MNYSDLTKAQKICIDAFIKLRPQLATANTITRPEIEEMFFELKDNRSTSGVKIGYPMWMVRQPKVSRGVYPFPGPSATQVVETLKPVQVVKTTKSQEELNQEDKEFFEELAEFGVELA